MRTRGFAIAVTILVLATVHPAAGQESPTAQPEATQFHGELSQKAGTAGCTSDTGIAGQCVDGRLLDGVTDIAVSPDGLHVYAVSALDNAVLLFYRNQQIGNLTQIAGTAGCVSESGSGGECQDGRGLVFPTGVDVSPDGKHVYVTSSISDAVAVFDRNQSPVYPGGVLTQKAGTDGCISETGSGGQCTDGRQLDGANSVLVSPDNVGVYVTAGGSDSVTTLVRDTTTGTLAHHSCTNDAGTSGCWNGRQMDFPNDVAISPDGAHAYVTTGTSDAVVVFEVIDTPGKALRPIFTGAGGCIDETGQEGCTDGRALIGATSVTVSPDGAHVYAASTDSDAVVRLTRNAGTGALSQPGGTTGCISEDGTGGQCGNSFALDRPTSVATSPDGYNLFVATSTSDGLRVFGRNRTTGNLSWQPSGADGCITETGTAGACKDGHGLNGARTVAISPDGNNAYAAAEVSDAITIFDITCTRHPYTDVPAWVAAAVDWSACNEYITGYADNTFRPNLNITRAQVARLIYRVAGSPNVSGLPGHGLSDVPGWVNDAVTWLTHNGYMTGYPDNTFRPNIPISRAQVTRATFRVQGEPPGAPPHPFSDVPPWLDDAVDWASEDPDGGGVGQPVVSGYPDGTFRPDNDITRGQTVRMTCRANVGPFAC